MHIGQEHLLMFLQHMNSSRIDLVRIQMRKEKIMLMYVWLVIGFVLLIKGADYFVEASSSIARALRVPSIIIGLTIVAFGTSAPELAVSTTAALTGNNEIAVGNVIGSNIFNILMVLAASAAVHPIAVTPFAVIDTACLIVASVVTWFLCRSKLRISRLEGAFMLFMYAGYLVYICVR